MAAQCWEPAGGEEHIAREKAKALGGAKLVLLQHCYKCQESQKGYLGLLQNRSAPMLFCQALHRKVLSVLHHLTED